MFHFIFTFQSCRNDSFHISESVPAPSFVLNQDRASDGSPSVSITFPDGYTDSLALSRYYSNARDKLARVEKCHFFGHLEGEPEACVAMTGCPGSDDLEFTILSKHSPDTMFKWTKDGDVQVIKSPFATGNARSEVLVREDETNQPGNWTLVGGDEEVNPAIEAAEAEIAASCTDADCESVPETNLLTLRFGYDEGFLAVTGSHDDAKAYIESTIPHIQTLYCHSTSLGTKIQLETVEEPKYVEGKYLTASVDSIVEMQPNTAEDLGEADLMVYMGWESAYSGVIGIAWKSTVCRPASWDSDDVKSSINEWRETHAEAGHLIAHELGHNLGMDHDFTDAHAAAGCDNTGVMSYGEAVYQWSTCSASDLQAHYILMKDYWCMPCKFHDFCREHSN